MLLCPEAWTCGGGRDQAGEWTGRGREEMGCSGGCRLPWPPPLRGGGRTWPSPGIRRQAPPPRSLLPVTPGAGVVVEGQRQQMAQVTIPGHGNSFNFENPRGRGGWKGPERWACPLCQGHAAGGGRRAGLGPGTRRVHQAARLLKLCPSHRARQPRPLEALPLHLPS